MNGIGVSAVTTRTFLVPNRINISTANCINADAALLTNWSSAVYPTANLAIGIPFALELPFVMGCLFVQNGSAVSGNFDIGVYDENFNRLVSTGSTAQSGTSVAQSVAAAYSFEPGQYYFVVCFDNTTATLLQKTAAVAAYQAALGTFQVANGAVTLPSTLTPALTTTPYLPVIGMSVKASV